MLMRNGNKQRLANKIIEHFPKHDIYIEPFFGAGGLFFKKPKAKINFINDISHDVFNLFMVLKNRIQDFLETFNNLPIDQTLFDFWSKNQESDPLMKAVRFVLLSNFSYLGQGNAFSLLPRNIKNSTFSKIPKVNQLLQNVVISNMDFEYFLKSICFENEQIKSRTFIYADPPYVNRKNNYGVLWGQNDTRRLFQVLSELDIKFAISETESDFILNLANDYYLNIIEIGEYKRLKSKRTELLITNYKIQCQDA